MAMEAPAASVMKPAPTKPMSRSQEILRRFDRNGDGRLDEDEKAAAHETMLEEQMAKDLPPATARGLGVFQALALELFDRNHDGRLDETERLDAMTFVTQSGDHALRETLLKRFDRNNDGKLDEAERREAQAFAEEHRGELMQELLLKRYDFNADNQLEPEEKMAIREAFLNMPPTEPERVAAQEYVQEQAGALMHREMLKRFDGNANGRLDPEEERAAQEYSQDHRGEIIREVLLQRFDKNGDGLLDETERATLHEALKAQNQSENSREAKAAAVKAEVDRRRGLREEQKTAGQQPVDLSKSTDSMPVSPEEKK